MKTPHLRHIRAAAALLPMLIILSAPGPASAQRTTGMLKGKITDAVSGDPIAAVNVIVMDAEGKITPQGAMTNEDGEYVIINVAPGTWTLSVSMLGYERVIRKGLEVAAGKTPETDFALTRTPPSTGTIKGTVTDRTTGKGLGAVNVILEPANASESLRTIGALTNADGEYVIINAPPGRYNLKALLPGFKSVAVEDVLVTIGVTTIRNFRLESSR